MILEKDIVQRIELNFGKDAKKVNKILEKAFNKNFHYHEVSRVIRCILYLCDNKLESLQHYIEVAYGDPRDVMFFAEYINLKENEVPKRVRDFSKEFNDDDNIFIE